MTALWTCINSNQPAPRSSHPISPNMLPPIASRALRVHIQNSNIPLYALLEVGDPIQIKLYFSLEKGT